MNVKAELTGVPHAGCAGCAHVDRRTFLGAASVLSLGAFLGACGDGVIDGPESPLDLLRDPVRLDLAQYPALQSVGGRALITPAGRAPVVVETVGVREYRAVSLICPHRGTVVDLTNDGFVCPNHGARFSRGGTWRGGQATVDLTPGALRVGGGVARPTPPTLEVSRTTVSFTATVGGGTPAAQTIALTNSGSGTVSGLSVALTYAANQPSGWLGTQLSSLSATTNNPASLTCTINRGSLGPGTYSATVTVSGTNTSNAPRAIAVTLVIVDTNTPPALAVSSTALSFSAAIGTNAGAQTVDILNTGQGTIGALSVSIAYGAGATGWLSTSSLSGTSTPSTLTVRPVVGALAAGTYTATLTVTGAGVAARTIAVSLTVFINGLAVTLSAWPALANIGGIASSVGVLNFQNVAVVRTGQNSYLAFSQTCPHAGSFVDVRNNASFECTNHGATFNANGTLRNDSPIQTGSLTPFRVTYTPGDAVLYVS
jgi:Rieske Fe-S protein